MPRLHYPVNSRRFPEMCIYLCKNATIWLWVFLATQSPCRIKFHNNKYGKLYGICGDCITRKCLSWPRLEAGELGGPAVPPGPATLPAPPLHIGTRYSTVISAYLTVIRLFGCKLTAISALARAKKLGGKPTTPLRHPQRRALPIEPMQSTYLSTSVFRYRKFKRSPPQPIVGPKT